MCYLSLLLIEGTKKWPDFITQIPTEYECWREVEVAFYNQKNQLIILYLDAIPLTRKIVLFKK